MYLFIKVKGTRPMTNQYLTVDVIATAKEKGGFIGQKAFKTAGKYGFDSLILTDANMQVLSGYISYVRPLLKPQCDFVPVNRNGDQHGKLGEIIKWCLIQLESTFIPRAIAELLKRRASISSLAKSFSGNSLFWSSSCSWLVDFSPFSLLRLSRVATEEKKNATPFMFLIFSSHSSRFRIYLAKDRHKTLLHVCCTII